MKKKIKDITIFEINDLCLKNPVCELCPLYISDSDIHYDCVVSLLDHCTLFQHKKVAEVIEQEVEI